MRIFGFPSVGSLLAIGLFCSVFPDRVAAGSSPAVYAAGVEMVALNVTVTSARQTYVENLTRDDFVVHEDGVPQPITIFGGGDVPLDLALLLDVSASVRDRLTLVRTAAKGFLKTLRPEDRGAIIGFSTRVSVLADWTADQHALGAAVDAARASGSTSLYGAIYVALRGLSPSQRSSDGLSRRTAIVVLSDGEDTSSLVSYDDVIDACRRSGVMVYTVRVARQVSKELEELLRRPARDGLAGEYVMNNLARETGARALTVKRLEELPAAYARIADELAHQYYIGYVPAAVVAGAERPFHALSVTLPGRPDAQARTRLGYARMPLVKRVAPSPLLP